MNFCRKPPIVYVEGYDLHDYDEEGNGSLRVDDFDNFLFMFFVISFAKLFF